jgi:hypothetical protein
VARIILDAANDPKRSAIVVIMQRLHEEDVSGHILSSESGEDFCHLMIPAEYDWRRQCVTVLGWQDPRGLDENDEPLVAVLPSGERVPRDTEAANELDRRDGALMWAERFGPTEIARIKAELGPYLASEDSNKARCRPRAVSSNATGGSYTNFRRSTISWPHWTVRSLRRSRTTRAV